MKGGWWTVTILYFCLLGFTFIILLMPLLKSTPESVPAACQVPITVLKKDKSELWSLLSQDNSAHLSIPSLPLVTSTGKFI